MKRKRKQQTRLHPDTKQQRLEEAKLNMFKQLTGLISLTMYAISKQKRVQNDNT
jgi:hypothetical protein